MNDWPRLRGQDSDIDDPDSESDTGLRLISIPAETDVSHFAHYFPSLV
jgi:hypothetical protein